MTAEKDLALELIEEVKAVDLKKSMLWPNIKIGPHQVVVGTASPLIKKFYRLIQETEWALKDLKRRHKKLPCKSDESNEFYNDFVSPLEDRLFLLRSLMKLYLRMEFPELIDKALIEVGRYGLAFWWNLPNQDHISVGYHKLVDDITE
ncbi:MAG: hypothetical protein A2611_01425 [Candidatus Komeilibacteria bacterium RIFOXYD1_FULL_37_29]|nr:MAG: hypothetical protein A2611_01425 [Candidatus Komeilibacteria bacterium RIFOXYD1_FULL_37_29]